MGLHHILIFALDKYYQSTKLCICNAYRVYRVYSVYSIYRVYSVYSIYRVYSVYRVYRVYSVYSIYSIYSVYSISNVLLLSFLVLALDKNRGQPLNPKHQHSLQTLRSDLVEP